jgi:hypothetical protein
MNGGEKIDAIDAPHQAEQLGFGWQIANALPYLQALRLAIQSIDRRQSRSRL